MKVLKIKESELKISRGWKYTELYFQVESSSSKTKVNKKEKKRA